MYEANTATEISSGFTVYWGTASSKALQQYLFISPLSRGLKCLNHIAALLSHTFGT